MVLALAVVVPKADVDGLQRPEPRVKEPRTALVLAARFDEAVDDVDALNDEVEVMLELDHAHLAAAAERDRAATVEGHLLGDEHGFGERDGVRPAAVEEYSSASARGVDLGDGVVQRLLGARCRAAAPHFLHLTRGLPWRDVLDEIERRAR